MEEILTDKYKEIIDYLIENGFECQQDTGVFHKDDRAIEPEEIIESDGNLNTFKQEFSDMVEDDYLCIEPNCDCDWDYPCSCQDSGLEGEWEWSPEECVWTCMSCGEIQ